MKKIIIISYCFVLALTSLSSSFAVVTIPSSDIQDSIEQANELLNNIDVSPASQDEELIDAVKLLYDNGVTIYSTPDTFMSSNYIRRDEVAKMFVVFRNKLSGLPLIKVNHDTACDFADLSLAHSDIVDNQFIPTSCDLGLFKGDRGNFLPTSNITKAQALAVLMRMSYGMSVADEKTQPAGGYAHWAWSYFNKATDIGLLKSLNISLSNLDESITRGDITKLLTRAIK